MLISCGVIVRSFFTRRRMQRGIGNGAIGPAIFGGRGSQKNVGEKPKFYDTWVQPGEGAWTCIMVSS